LLRKIRIHPLFWLIIAAGTLTGHLWDTAIAFTIVLIHELGHAVMAQWFGWKVIEIDLLPFGGVAKLDEQEEHPFYQECLVLIAGPLQNVWLPLLSYAMMAFPFWGTEQHQIFLAQNSALLLFNLLPIWPLDGGRLLHVMLEVVYPFKHAYKRALYFSLGALFLFCILAVWQYPFSINLWVIISFIMFAIYKEWRVIPLRFIRFLLAFSGSKQKFLRLKRLSVPEETPLVDVFSMYYKNAEHRIRIVGENQSDIDGKELANEYFKGHCDGKTIGDWR
jgi:stage IV sporulation protein FB